MYYYFSIMSTKPSAPQKLHILGQLAEGLLTDAQAIDKYELSSKLLQAWRKWRHLNALVHVKPISQYEFHSDSFLCGKRADIIASHYTNT